VAQVSNRRAVVERLVQITRDEAASKRRSVATIDPIIRAGRKTYPYLSERELIDYASAALRIILNNREANTQQMTLIAY
jgi:hypothetical protein